MSVSAFPIILVDSATGSDSLASGAGPATALTGSAAISTGTTVVLDAGTVLTGVATDGSHVLYFADATAGNRNFTAINGTSGSGGATPTVTVEQSLASTTKSWAVGGKRASMGSSTSGKLVENNSSAGDAMPGWTVRMSSGHTETIAGPLNQNRRAGDGTSGPITYEGVSGAMTPPVLTFNNDGVSFYCGDGHVFRNFEMRNSNGSKTASIAFVVQGATNYSSTLENLKISDGAHYYFRGIYISGNCGATVRGCSIGNTVDFGIYSVINTAEVIEYNYVFSTGNDAIRLDGIQLGAYINNNIIANATNHGINFAGDSACNRSISVCNNTIYNCSGDGIRVIRDAQNCFMCRNNVISNNGGYGVQFTVATDISIAACGIQLLNNSTYNNTSGAYKSTTSGYSYNNCPWASGDNNLDPTFTNASGGDFSIGTNLKAKGYPLGGTLPVGTFSSTYSYVDPGVAQRQEAGGSSGGLLIGGGMTGGNQKT